MATADELFGSMFANVPEHTHRVVDDDTYFIIDPISRQIESSGRTTNVLVQYDHNSERFTFEIPRYVEEHDMMLCNRVEVHYDNVGADGTRLSDVYEVDDLRIDPNNKDAVICTWLISRNATQLVGTLNFNVRYICVDDNGNLVYEWHTEIYDGVDVKPGRSNSQAAVSEYSDILEGWRQKLFSVKDSLTADLVTTSETQQAEIEAKGLSTLESIPEDYTTVANMADEALRTKAEAIELSASGEYIFLDDSSDYNLLGLNLYGKTEQDVTTGAQLLDLYDYADGKDTNIFSVNDEMILTVNNVGTYPIVGFSKDLTGLILSGTYTFTIYDGAQIYVQFSSNDYSRYAKIGESITFDYDGSSYLRLISVDVQPGTKACYKLMLNIGSSAHPYELYTGGVVSPSPEWPQELKSVENPIVKIHGSNLFNFDGITEREGIVRNSDGSITCSVYACSTGYVLSYFAPSLSVGQTVRLDIDTDGPDHIYLGITKRVWRNGTVETITQDMLDSPVYIYANPENEPAIIRSIQIVIDGVDQDYEAYIPPQTLAISRTLNAVGDIRDEIDFERGKFIQRTKLIDLKSVTDWHTWGVNYMNSINTGFYVFDDTLGVDTENVLCSILSYHRQCYGGANVGASSSAEGRQYYTISVPNTLLADTSSNEAAIASLRSMFESTDAKLLVTIKPIETDITPTELEAFRALYTNATNTTILNDQNVNMNVEYVADLKSYIDKRIRAIVSSVSSTNE